MIDLLSTGNNKKNISGKYLLVTFFVCISMVAWFGISDLRADGNDPEPNSDEFEGGFQNITQEKHAENIATEAASQDSDPNHNIEYYMGLIEDWRESGMGWGDIIVHNLNKDPYNLDIHPSVLGLGHFPTSSEAVHSSKHSIMQSGNNQGQGLALGHNKDKSSNLDGGHGGGNGGGHGGGNGGDHGGGNGGGRK